MIVLKLLIFSCFFSLISKADNSIDNRRQEIKTLAQSKSPNTIPGFVTGSPAEASLNDVYALEDAADRAFINNKTANHVKKIAETRRYFVLDGEKDPIFVNSKRATKNPKEFLNGPMSNRKPNTNYEWKSCKESKTKTKLKCSKVLLSQKVVIEPEIYERRIPFSYLSGPTAWVWAQERTKFNNSPVTKIKGETVRTQEEKWSNGCHALEKKEKLGICKKVKIVCPKGKETREVTGEILKGKSLALLRF